MPVQQAQEQNKPDLTTYKELTLETAQNLALQHHPRLQAVQYEIAATAAGRQQAEAWRNPEIAVEPQNVAGNDGGFHGSEVTLSLRQELPINGALTLAGQAAGQKEIVARCEAAEEKRTFLAEVYLSFYQCLLSQQRVEQLRQIAETAATLLDKTRRMVDAGKNPQVDLLKVEVSHASLLVRYVEAQNTQLIATKRLSSLICRSDSPLPPLRGELLPVFTLLPWTHYQERLMQHPRLSKWQAEQRRANLQKQEASAQIWPNPEVTFGVRRDYAGPENSLVFGLALPLPLWNQNSGAVAEAEALQQKALAQENAERKVLGDELFAAYQQALTARHNIERYEKHILPASRQARELTYQGYEQGKITLLETITAQQTEIEAHLSFLQEVENLHTALAALYRLTDVAAGRE
jgi:cobalt-zinc-cadmium efflux system outer membrane protein